MRLGTWARSPWHARVVRTHPRALPSERSILFGLDLGERRFDGSAVGKERLDRLFLIGCHQNEEKIAVLNRGRTSRHDDPSPREIAATCTFSGRCRSARVLPKA